MMGSVMDSGHYASKALEAKEKPCTKSKDGEHEWVLLGSWPSTWEECKFCEVQIYWK